MPPSSTSSQNVLVDRQRLERHVWHALRRMFIVAAGSPLHCTASYNTYVRGSLLWIKFTASLPKTRRSRRAIRRIEQTALRMKCHDCARTKSSAESH
jgi:hypothetical protein